MIKINELREIIKTIIYTSYVKHEKPVSAMFIADKGSGKSEILKQFNSFDGIHTPTDITYRGLLELLEKDKTIKFIVIPDFLKITMKPKSTSDNIISFLNAVIEEGASKFNFPNRSFDLQGRQIGLLTATTSDSFFKNQREWDSIGFISRLLPISFSYSEQTKKEVLDFIEGRSYLNDIFKKELLPKKLIDIKMEKHLASGLRDKKLDFRRQKQYQNMAMARAIIHKRRVVTNKDIDDVNQMKKYINLDFVEI